MADALRPATVADLERIAVLHEAAFPGFFLTRMGRPFLRAYYAMVLEYARGITLVAESDDGVVGFVTGFHEPEGFYRLMRARKLRFVGPLALGILQRPSTLPGVLANVRKVQGGSAAGSVREGKPCELSSLGVLPSASGRGLGQALVRAFLERAAGEGADRIYLTTDADGNERVNAFYQKLGFALTESFEGHPGRRMNLYVLEV